VPVLVSRSHGCVDSIREHISGEYIDLSASGICRGIETMLDAGLRKRLGAGGRRFATENFDYKVMWPQILKLYNSILR
ncbi:MAG: glycosyltransferase family 1 protein, partial [Muribaculaceae bacterium]|nr:glycosyltransferase family 1 protein [Muribaculaceae bacterium]